MFQDEVTRPADGVVRALGVLQPVLAGGRCAIPRMLDSRGAHARLSNSFLLFAESRARARAPPVLRRELCRHVALSRGAASDRRRNLGRNGGDHAVVACWLRCADSSPSRSTDACRARLGARARSAWRRVPLVRPPGGTRRSRRRLSRSPPDPVGAAANQSHADLGVEQLGAVYERARPRPARSDDVASRIPTETAGRAHSRRRKETGTSTRPSPWPNSSCADTRGLPCTARHRTTSSRFASSTPRWAAAPSWSRPVVFCRMRTNAR